MEGNQFAAFSFSGRPPVKKGAIHSVQSPLRKSKGEASRRSSANSQLKIGEPRRRDDSATKKLQQEGENLEAADVEECRPLDLSNGFELSENVPRRPFSSSREEEIISSVATVEKTERLGHDGEAREVASAVQAKEIKAEPGEELGASPSFQTSASFLIEDEVKVNSSSADIEDWFQCGIVSKEIIVSPGELQITKTKNKRWKESGKKSLPSEVQVPPADWELVLHHIRIMRTGRDAPVDLHGTEQLIDKTADLETQKFHVLVAAMISSQTRDSVTGAAMRRLHAAPGGLTLHRIAQTDVTLESLEELLKPVLYYRQKAKHLKSMAEILLKPPHCGSVPRSLDELMKLPGVGPKVGLLVLWVGFGMGEVGLIVDSNVRRVSCRLGWASEGSTPAQVREALEMWLPKDLWPEVSYLFVGFGQQICKPGIPKCEDCRLKNVCPSAFMGRKPTIKREKV